MNTVTKITQTPEVFCINEKDGHETIWHLGRGTLIHYSDGSIKKGEFMTSGYYREVGKSQSSDPEVRTITSLAPDTFESSKRYFRPIKIEKSLVEAMDAAN
jgi:hypothetical protein